MLPSAVSVEVSVSVAPELVLPVSLVVSSVVLLEVSSVVSFCVLFPLVPQATRLRASTAQRTRAIHFLLFIMCILPFQIIHVRVTAHRRFCPYYRWEGKNVAPGEKFF